MTALALVDGDTRPTSLTYADKKTGPINIDGYTFLLRLGRTPTIERTCTIVDAVNGVLMIPWEDGDIVTGTWPMEMRVTDPDGKVNTCKLQDLVVGSRLP